MTADDECYDGAQLYLDYFACFKDEVKVVTELVLSPLWFFCHRVALHERRRTS